MVQEKPHEGTSAEAREVANRKVINRLRRARGQLAAVIAAVERDAPCQDTVQQITAVSKAVDRAGYLLVSGALTECLRNPGAPGKEDPDELEELFLTLA